MKNEKYNVTGMTCAACQANITRNVGKLDGVREVNVNLLANSMTVSYDENMVTPQKIMDTVASIGYGASPEVQTEGGKDRIRAEWESRRKSEEDSRRAMKRRLITSVAILVPLMYIAMGGMIGLPEPPFFSGMENALIFALTQLLMTIPIVIINGKFFTSGFKALFKGAPNMDSLVALGSSAALAYGIISLYFMAYGFGHGDMDIVHRYAHALYFESAAMILTLVTVGKYLEARSKSKTSDALGRLVDLAPKTACVIRNGEEVTIPAEQVAAGDIVVIRPAQTLPVDGVIVEGSGLLDQSAITGESMPVEKSAGDSVISASTNTNGTFRYKASRVGSDTTLAQIIRLVDEAGSSKAPIARIADKVSGIFVPVVIGIAILTAIVWLLAGKGAEFAMTNAIAVLVISCPCALGLATPVAIMVGTGKAAEQGILIKSAETLENLHNIDTIVLDKTGTITSGKPSVTDIILFDDTMSERDFIALAAAVESGSEHPLALAVTERAKSDGITVPAAENFSATSGRGVSAVIDNVEYIAGNPTFIRERGIQYTAAEDKLEHLAKQGKTPLIFCRGDKLLGIIAVADTVREDSAAAIKQFREMGLHVVMLTGDNAVTAEAIRSKLDIESVISDVLPAEKESCIRRLQSEGRKVAMVGDGINDAPALSRADIGIAVGAGTDIAIDSADMVLMKSSLYDVVTAIELSRAVIRNIKMNLFWAFFYNILGIPVAAGLLYPLWQITLSPMIGSAAMSLSSVCVVTNALRLRSFKPKHTAQSENKVQNIKEETQMKKVLEVEGMMCGHCKAHVEKALGAVEGVAAVTADVENKRAEITLSADVPDDVLIAAVKEAGYEPGKFIN